ncbi:hypothetical protein DERF_010385 [Dermatophagoides farinae]|uniref:Uncharacterized protein n=1 Tax=Dermatophagoides farinae TaxID=6954 RepID=A0A922HW09_DERFA|nr:hypothetical protein DERF_010385 [Dermatophagoides farinae]
MNDINCIVLFCVWIETIKNLSATERSSFEQIKLAIENDNKGKRLKNMQELANIKRKSNESLPKLATRICHGIYEEGRL